MRSFWLGGALFGAILALGACVGSGRGLDGADKYTINLQRPNQVLTGRPLRNFLVDRNVNSGEVKRVLDANPGLREALLRNGVEIRRVSALRVGPTYVVDVFTKA